jgi:dolichol kinase
MKISSPKAINWTLKQYGYKYGSRVKNGRNFSLVFFFWGGGLYFVVVFGHCILDFFMLVLLTGEKCSSILGRDLSRPYNGIKNRATTRTI